MAQTGPLSLETRSSLLAGARGSPRQLRGKGSLKRLIGRQRRRVAYWIGKVTLPIRLVSVIDEGRTAFTSPWMAKGCV